MISYTSPLGKGTNPLTAIIGVSRVSTPSGVGCAVVVLSHISGDSTIVMSNALGKHHDRQLRKDLTFLVCRHA